MTEPVTTAPTLETQYAVTVSAAQWDMPIVLGSDGCLYVTGGSPAAVLAAMRGIRFGDVDAMLRDALGATYVL